MKQRNKASIGVIVISLALWACTAVNSTLPSSSTAWTGAKEQRITLANKAHQLAETARQINILTLYSDDKLRVRVKNFKGTTGIKRKAGSLAVKADGDDVEVSEATASCEVAVRDGAPHQIDLVEDEWPVMSDHDNVTTLTDRTANSTLVCFGDQEFQRFKAQNGGKQLVIVTNPDGTYTIDGKPMATIEEAAGAIVSTDVGRATTPECLAALEGTLLTVEELAKETLGRTICNTGRGSRAGPPPATPAALVKEVLARKLQSL